MFNREVHMAFPLKFTVLYVIKFCIFSIVECANNRNNVIRHCIDKQPCIGTYGDIYNASASGENSYNIRAALYPAKKPSSVLVFVNVYGPNGTQSPRSNAVKYIWSTNCLFVALPTAVLQGMSLGSILVDPRTGHLDITLPSFCCKVCESKREKMIEDVIAEVSVNLLVDLQDLAVSPAIPDPRLNTAECVIKDHEPRELDTRHSNLIYSMLFCSFISVMLLGPLLAHFILEFLKNYPENTNSFCFWKEKPIVHAADSIVFVMLLIDIPFIIYTFAKSYKTELPMIFLIVFIGIITTEGPGTQGRNQDTMKRNKGVFCSLIYYISVNLLLYHFSWLLIGIMITPTWGLTVFLIILVFVISSFFLLWHLFLCASSQAFIFSGVCFFGFCSAAVVPVLAGQSFYGRETADDIIKVVLLYII
ncbi:unnamed protein product, partial [Pocillopora meandrina]